MNKKKASMYHWTLLFIFVTLTLNYLAQCTVYILFIKKKYSFKKIVRCCSN